MNATRYAWQVIASFADAETERLFHGIHSRRLPTDIQRRAHKKLLLLHAATSLDDLRNPPSNRLEALKGKRLGQHSIRINDQWRVCFRWDGGNAHDGTIADDH